MDLNIFFITVIKEGKDSSIFAIGKLQVTNFLEVVPMVFWPEQHFDRWQSGDGRGDLEEI